MADTRLDVLTIGNAIVDVIADASDDFLAEEGLVKGAMRLVDAEEARRLYGVLNRRLEGRAFMCDDYSIADIATWPWISRFEYQDIDLNDFPNVRRWYVDIAGRPAVQKGYRVPQSTDIPMPKQARV